MANRPVHVTKSDVTRAVRGALDAGLSIGRVEVDPRTGRIALFSVGADADALPNPCDRLLK